MIWNYPFALLIGAFDSFVATDMDAAEYDLELYCEANLTTN